MSSRIKRSFALCVVLIGPATALGRASAMESAGDQTSTPRAAPARVVLQEVVVTAQRRSQNLQNVPVSVNTASAVQLERTGVQSAGDLSVMAPSVRVSTGLGGADIAIRGISGTGSGADEPANAVYIDGVYQSSPAASLFEFNNIERVEVIEGPQGTLFGRNAAGGLIQIITRPPRFSPEAQVQVGYGNYGTARVSLYATGPLSRSVAMDFAGVIDHQGDGWGHNVANGRDTYRGENSGARSKLLWNIDPATNLVLTGTFSRAYAPSLQGGGLLPGERAVDGFQDPGYFDTNRNVNDRAGTVQQNYAATFTHKFSWGTFKSITSRDDVRFHVAKDLDLSPVPILGLNINSHAKTWTQELQLASAKRAPITWVGGLFYYYNDLLTDPLSVSGIAIAPLQFADTYSDASTRSYAAYGQTTFVVAKGMHFTTGLRYTQDERHIDFTTSTSLAGVPPVIFPRQSVTNDKLTWRLALDRRLSKDDLIYVSYSRGFKSGLFNATNPGLPPARPETVDAYEVGLKSETFRQRLRANVSAFYNSVEDIQLRGIPQGVPTPIFYNAAHADFKGVDLELEGLPAARFRILANASYLFGRYGAGFTNALFYAVPPPPAGGLLTSTGDASGNRPVLSPEWAGSLTGQYRMPTAAGSVLLSATYSFTSHFYFDPQDRLRQPGYGLLNATASWSPTASLQLMLWGKNLTDRRYYSNIEPSNFGDEYYPGVPRTYGVSIGWSLE